MVLHLLEGNSCSLPRRSSESPLLWTSGLPRSLPYGGMGRRRSQGAGALSQHHTAILPSAPRPGCSTALCPSVCPFSSQACGRKPAQEPPASKSWEHLERREAGCSRRKMSLGTLAPPWTPPPIGCSVPTCSLPQPVLGQSLATLQGPALGVTSPEKPPPAPAPPRRTTLAETTGGG